MKIAVVSAHFMPEIGYQEVQLAKAYARLGHRVKVFTSTSISPSGRKVIRRKYFPGLTSDTKYGFEVCRLKPWCQFGSNVFVSGLKEAVFEFRPDAVIIIGLAKMFAGPLLSRDLSSQTNLITVFGDAREYRNTSSFSGRCLTFLQEMGFSVAKRRLYRKAVQVGQRLILNVPETENIFLSLLNNAEKSQFQAKRVQLSLGYDPDEFFFESKSRDEVRTTLNISHEEVVLITSTRVNPRKKLEHIITLVSRLYAQGQKVRYIIIGFLGDSYERELKAYIGEQPSPTIFHCFSFSHHKDIRHYYCAADLGIWLRAAISIQEAMGTGLPIVLENKPSVNHLIREGINGWFFENGHLPHVLEAVISEIANRDAEERLKHRRYIASINFDKVSYPKIAEKIISGL